jgi:hypothetical protein
MYVCMQPVEPIEIPSLLYCYLYSIITLTMYFAIYYIERLSLEQLCTDQPVRGYINITC